MLQKIWKKDDCENINTFKDIKILNNYSKYSKELNRMFKYRSFDFFIKDIKTKKTSNVNDIISIYKRKNEENKDKNVINFNHKKFKEYMKKLGKKENELTFRLLYPFIARQQKIHNKNIDNIIKIINNKNNAIKYKDKNTIKYFNIKNNIDYNNKSNTVNKNYIKTEYPEIGRYDPNFSTIRKNEFKAFISKTKFSRVFNNDNTKDYNSNFEDICMCKKMKRLIKNNNNELQKETSSISKNNSKISNSFPSKKINLKEHIKENKKIKNININNCCNNNDICDNHYLTSRNKKSKLKLNIKSKQSNNSFDRSVITSRNDVNVSDNNSEDNIDYNQYNIYVNTCSDLANNYMKNNHTLKFESYTDRQPIFKQKSFSSLEDSFSYSPKNLTINRNRSTFVINTNANSLLNNNLIPQISSTLKNINTNSIPKNTTSKIFQKISPKNSSIGLVRFDKMSSNPYTKSYIEKEILRTKDIPSLGIYNPRFGSIFSKEKIPIFSVGNYVKKAKNLRLSQILHNYKVGTEYELVKELNKKNEKGIE